LIEFLAHSTHVLKINIFEQGFINEEFNDIFLKKILAQFFEIGWWDAVEFLLDRINETNVSNPFLDLDLNNFKSDENEATNKRDTSITDLNCLFNKRVSVKPESKEKYQ
jgi:hypothetical protein